MAENNYSILIVDDDKQVLEFICQMISALGHNCACAEDGRIACKMLDNNSYDLVLTDVSMPNMDGLQLLEYIRTNYYGIDVIVMTGYSELYSYNDIIAAGAIDYLNKPFSRQELGAKLERVCRERSFISRLNAQVKEREKSEKKLSVITSTANDAIIMINHLGRVSFWNQAAERIFGFSVEESIGRDLLELIVPERFADKFRENCHNC